VLDPGDALGRSLLAGRPGGESGAGSFAAVDATTTVGLGALAIAAWALQLRRRSLVPERDPRLAESLQFENA